VFSDLDTLLAHSDGTLSRKQLLDYTLDGESLPLIDYSRGIRNPRALDATLAVVSDPNGPYPDEEVFPGVWRYSFRSGSTAGDNTKLIAARDLKAEIILFHKPRPNTYQPIYPVRVVDVDLVGGHVILSLKELVSLDTSAASSVEREWALALTMRRVHQPAFRSMVLRAYGTRCTVCSFRHAELLDAAHIIGDRRERGDATVTNGMAMCKIHHAAYDKNFLGVTPDYEIRIDTDLLKEVDGPMLRHGLQEMHGKQIGVPNRPADRPDRDRLAERFAEFSAR
jgi:putative restriction endonuclease